MTLRHQKTLFLILAAALLVRLYHMHAPIIGMHSWRQGDTAAIARNFHENGYRLFYPQIDWGGNSQGYVESEFQIYPFLVSLLYSVFGVHEALGRLLSTLFALLAIYLLYLFVKRYLSKKTALWSAFIFSFLPLNI